MVASGCLREGNGSLGPNQPSFGASLGTPSGIRLKNSVGPMPCSRPVTLELALWRLIVRGQAAILTYGGNAM